MKVSAFEPFAPGLSDFTPLLARVRDQGAEVLLSDTFSADHLLLVRQMAQAGIRLKAFLGAFGMEFPGVIKELGPASEGLYGTMSWQPGVNLGGSEKESLAFIEAFRQRFGTEPVPLTMHGYAAARALLGALESVAASGRPPGRSFNMLFNMANVLRAPGRPRQPGGSLMVYGGAGFARRLLPLDDAAITARYLADLHALYPRTRDIVEEVVIQRWERGLPYPDLPGRRLSRHVVHGDIVT